MPKKKQSKSTKCNFKVKGDQLADFVKQAFKEGNIRRIIIKDGKGKTYMEIPVTVGVFGFLIAPPLVALGAVAAMVGAFEVEIVRRNGKK